jgi:hypothetical protein
MCLDSDPSAHSKGRFSPIHQLAELISHVNILGDDVEDNTGLALIDVAHQHLDQIKPAPTVPSSVQ